MPQHFLLPCPHCDRKLTIEPSQAGQQAACACGGEVAVPTYREIKQLPPAEETQPERPSRRWSRLQGVMFSLGILICLMGVAMGTAPLLDRLKISLEKPPPPDLTSNFQAIDGLTPEETLQVWDQFVSDGVNRQGAPAYISNREVAGKLNLVIGIAGLLVAAGLSSTIGAFFVRPR